MAPQTKFEFVILKFSYLPKLDPLYPRIEIMQKPSKPHRNMTHVYHWFERSMCKEMSKIPAHLKVRYCEWNIKTGNADLFTIYGYRFDNVYLMLGEETVHWIYYHSQPMRRRLEGTIPLTDNFCSCCIHNQYMKIMHSVKSYILNLAKKK